MHVFHFFAHLEAAAEALAERRGLTRPQTFFLKPAFVLTNSAILYSVNKTDSLTKKVGYSLALLSPEDAAILQAAARVSSVKRAVNDMKYAEMTSKWLRPCFTKPHRYSTTAEFLLCYDSFNPPPCFRASFPSSGKKRAQSAPSTSQHLYLPLLDLKKTLTLSIASIPVIDDRPFPAYHMSQPNDALIFQSDHLTNGRGNAINFSSESRSPRVPLQHEKVLAMLDDCDTHTGLLARMETLRQYFPLTLTTMVTETAESLLLSARASSYAGTNSGSGSSNQSVGAPLSGVTGSLIPRIRTAPLVDIYQDGTPSTSVHNDTIMSGGSKHVEVSVNKTPSASFHVSDIDCHVNVAPLLQSHLKDETSESHGKVSNERIDSSPILLSTSNESAQTSQLMRFILGTDSLDVLSEYKRSSSNRKELLRRPGRNILSLVSDRVYMGDPFHLLVLLTNVSGLDSLKRPLFQVCMPPETGIFPCYWEGTVGNRTATRAVISINDYQIKLIVPPSPSVYERFTPSFNPVCSAQFNRTAKLISNAAYYTCIWQLKALEPISGIDVEKEEALDGSLGTELVSQVADRLFLHVSRAASIALSKRSSSLVDSNWQHAQSTSDSDTDHSLFAERVAIPSTYATCESHNSIPDPAQSEPSSILDLLTTSPESLSPAVMLADTSVSVSDHVTPVDLRGLFRKPLRSKECLKKHTLRQLSQIVGYNSQSFTTGPSPSQQLITSSLGPSILSSAGTLSASKRDHGSLGVTNKYATRREHMFKAAYEMGLSHKG